MSDIVVYGKGKTGKSLLKMLQRLNKNATSFDDATGFEGVGKFTADELVVVSPGVPPDANGIVEAKKVGSNIVGELEFCFPYCLGKCISVTGTNGKTTVCEMIYHIFRNVGISTYLLGNGGVPFSEKVLDIDYNDIVVLESSSFQLSDCKRFAPHISVFTNLAPDHLNWHGGFKAYVESKKNNFVHMAEGFAIFNKDDAAVEELSAECNVCKLYYSVKDSSANCYFDGKSVILHMGDKRISADAIYLRDFAYHNISNALAAVLACCCEGVSLQDAVSSLKDFTFPPHRLQKIDSIGGVDFIDDSKATNVHATVSALRCFDKRLALILGGSDKGEDYSEIFRVAQPNIKAIVAVGQTAEAIKECGNKYEISVTVLNDIKQAVRFCFDLLKYDGGVVLMSNACASFDRFRDFEERGSYFARAVEEIKSENQKN